jgi:serine/threonine-protein phosphatase 5
MTDESPISTDQLTALRMDENGLSSDDLILTLKNKGNAALQAGHFVEAIELYTQAISVSSKPNAILLSNRSQALIKIENYGLAIADATAAIAADPSYPKGYYRRGTATFALNKPKEARKDFRMVCQLVPQDKDARSRLAECEKIVKEAAFAAAITSMEVAPLSETYDSKNIPMESSYDGPHPCLEEKDRDAMFEPGVLPRDFVMVRYLLLLPPQHYFKFSRI